MRSRLLGAARQLHFLDVPEDELLRRLAERTVGPSRENFQISAEMMRPWMVLFQRPSLDELEPRYVRPSGLSLAHG